MSKHSDIKLLKEIEDILFSGMNDLYNYAGIAFLTNDEENMNLFKGQYIALDRTRKIFEKKRLELMVSKNG